MKLSECTGDDFLKDIELTSYSREKIFIQDSPGHRRFKFWVWKTNYWIKSAVQWFINKW